MLSSFVCKTPFEAKLAVLNEQFKFKIQKLQNAYFQRDNLSQRVLIYGLLGCLRYKLQGRLQLWSLNSVLAAKTRRATSQARQSQARSASSRTATELKQKTIYIQKCINEPLPPARMMVANCKQHKIWSIAQQARGTCIIFLTQNDVHCTRLHMAGASNRIIRILYSTFRILTRAHRRCACSRYLFKCGLSHLVIFNQKYPYDKTKVSWYEFDSFLKKKICKKSFCIQ